MRRTPELTIPASVPSVDTAPKLPDRAKPGTVIGSIAIPAQEATRQYEVAAWWAKLDIPAQVVELRVGHDSFHSPFTATVDAWLTERHTPSLFGGVAYGTGGSGKTHEATTHTLSWRDLPAEAVLNEEGQHHLAALEVIAAYSRKCGAERAAIVAKVREFTDRLDEGNLMYRVVADGRWVGDVEIIIAGKLMVDVERWAKKAELPCGVKVHDLFKFTAEDARKLGSDGCGRDMNGQYVILHRAGKNEGRHYVPGYDY